MKITVMGVLMIVASAVLLIVVLDQVGRRLNANYEDHLKRIKADGNDQPNNPNN